MRIIEMLQFLYMIIFGRIDVKFQQIYCLIWLDDAIESVHVESYNFLIHTHFDMYLLKYTCYFKNTLQIYDMIKLIIDISNRFTNP